VATLTITDLPDELYRKLVRRAERNQRSVADEVINLLAGSVSAGKPALRPTVADFRALRERYPLASVTAEEIEDAITEGRP
jgi:plasmid stability protein